MTLRTRLGALPSIALPIAFVCSLAFLAAGFLVPVYEDVTVSSDSPAVTRTSMTLVAENGPWVVVVLLVPLVATVVVAIALLGRAHPAAIVIAWSATGALAVLNLLAMLTIGIFVVPITVALVVACAGATNQHTARRSPVREAR